MNRTHALPRVAPSALLLVLSACGRDIEVETY